MKTKLIHILLFVTLFLPFAPMAQNGIDVSHYQDSINWKKVAKNTKIEFVYVKATEGATVVDRMYKYNMKKASEAGLLVGSYHVYSGRSTAFQQFDNFKKTVGKINQDIVPVLDIEATHINKLYMKRVDKLLELMEKEYGVKPIIYTSERLYMTHFNIPKYKQYHYFIANYNREPKMAYTIWQYTQRGKQSGIAGFVDFSKIHSKYSIKTIKMPSKKKKDNKDGADSAVVADTTTVSRDSSSNPGIIPQNAPKSPQTASTTAPKKSSTAQAPKKTSAKPSPKKTTAKKPAAKKSTAKKTAAKKPAAKKPAAKKTTAKKPAAKKPAAKKSTSKKS